MTETNGTGASCRSVDRRDRLRKLHEREDPLLHARAAGGGHATSGTPRLAAPLAGPGELLPDGAPHGTAHEREIHHRELARCAARSRPRPRRPRRRGPWRARPARCAPCTPSGRRTGAGRRSAGRLSDSTNVPRSAICVPSVARADRGSGSRTEGRPEVLVELLVAVVGAAARARVGVRPGFSGSGPRSSMETRSGWPSGVILLRPLTGRASGQNGSARRRSTDRPRPP